MIVVGENSYIDVNYMDEYISKYAGFQSPVIEAWDNLEDEQKEMLLIKSAIEIDSLDFIGCKKYKNQVLQLPRHTDITSVCKDGVWEFNNYIKFAQAENVVSLIEAKYTGNGGRAKRILEGVKSFSLDGFSETYGDVVDTRLSRVSSPESIKFLSSWLNGGFDIL